MTTQPNSVVTALLALCENIAKSMQLLDSQIKQVAPDAGSNSIQHLFSTRSTLTGLNRSFQLAQQMVNDLANYLSRTEDLIRISALLSSSLNIDAVLAEVIDQVIILSGARRAYLMLHNPATHELDVRVARNWEHQTLLEQAIQFSHGVVNLALDQQQAIMTLNARNDSRFNEMKSVIEFGLTSILCIPLVFQGQIVGVLYADGDEQTVRFDNQYLPILNAFASQAAMAIKNAQNFENVSADLEHVQQEAQRLRIHEATLASGDVLHNILETVTQVFDLPYAAIALKQGDQFVVSAECGTATGAPDRIPLAYQGEVVGELVVAYPSSSASVNPGQEYLLRELTRQIGIAVYAARLSSDMQHARERLVSAREEERRRLRRDLHDGLGPTVASLMFKIDAVRNLLPSDPQAADRILVGLKTQVETTLVDIRRLVYQLRPPALDELGLVQALHEYAMRYDVPGGFKTTFNLAEGAGRLPAAVEVAVYLITLEALTNVARHARAHHSTVQLTFQTTGLHSLLLLISDDGCGLGAEHRLGVGLLSMKERASELGGSCTIETMSTGGVCVTARIPLLGT